MNRLQFAPPPTPKKSSSTHNVQQSLLQTATHDGVHHAMFVPGHYEPNYAYPLLVWLHGDSDDERQLQRVMPLISMRNYVAVAPRGSSICDGGTSGFRWRQTDESIAQAEHDVFECIELARSKFNISPARIFIGGYGSGGTMALRVALNHPHRFAGMMTIGGPFPTGSRPLANLAQARRLQLFIAQGRDAADYPVDQMCGELRLFHAGGLSVTLRQYPCGDELTTQMLHDLNVWVMEQVTGTSSTPPESSNQCRGDAN